MSSATIHHRRKETSPTKGETSESIVHPKVCPLDSKNGPLSKVSPESTPSGRVTWANAAFYVLSGCSQPLILALCKNAGLADSSCQIYMFFYALGPTIGSVPLIFEKTKWPSWKTIMKAAGICFFDIFCTVANYTGASKAGPTLFSIVYSSVTIWTAVFSQILLDRRMRRGQWLAVMAVFGGLVLTATDSQELGEDVMLGLILISIGSAMHAMTYILSEGIMTVSEETLSVRQNNAIQSSVAATTLLLWQILYTLPRWEEKIGAPMQASGTSTLQALGILLLFSASNLVHSSTFFHTLRHFPGGSTSAGVMKGLQAVMVFVITHFAYCGLFGGPEMCFSKAKFLSLVTVSGGVMGYGVATSYYSSLKPAFGAGKSSEPKKGILAVDTDHVA